MSEENKTICSGCNGKGVIIVRAQMTIKNRRVCHNENEICPVCLGTMYATQEQVDKFLLENFGE